MLAQGRVGRRRRVRLRARVRDDLIDDLVEIRPVIDLEVVLREGGRAPRLKLGFVNVGADADAENLRLVDRLELVGDEGRGLALVLLAVGQDDDEGPISVWAAVRANFGLGGFEAGVSVGVRHHLRQVRDDGLDRRLVRREADLERRDRRELHDADLDLILADREAVESRNTLNS